MAAGKLLNLPAVPSVRYANNLIETAVCELRFPTVLELETRAPTNFQSKLRKSYPFYQRQVIETIGDAAGQEVRYLFRSKDQLIDEFHETNFALFSWCLGEKAKALLGEGKSKAGGKRA